MKNNNANNINVTLNLIQSLFKFNKLGNGEICQGLRHWRPLPKLKNNFSKPVRNDMGRHPEDGSPKYLHTQNHVIMRNNVEQEVQKLVRSDVVIPNELGNGETCQGLRHWRLLSNLKNNFSKPVRNDMGRHPEDSSPKDLQTQNHVITRKNIEQEMQKSTQRDVVIPNKLGNGEICQGLRHWRPLPKLKNNFSKPVRNDMDNKRRLTLLSRQLNKLDCFAFARNDAIVEFEDKEGKKMLKIKT